MSVSPRPGLAIRLLLPALVLACAPPDADEVQQKAAGSGSSADVDADDGTAPARPPEDPSSEPPGSAVKHESVLNTPSIELPRFPASGRSWSSMGTIAARPAAVTMSDGRIAVGSTSGLYTYDGASWTVVVEEDIGSITGVAYHADTLVIATSSGAWTLSDAEGLQLVLPNPDRWSWPRLDHGEAGVFVSVDDLAYRVTPDLELLGDADGIVDAQCGTQVEDNALVIYSLDEDRWVDLPLPGDLTTIFEFASRATEDWVFGMNSVWHTEDAGETWSAVAEVEDLYFYDVRREGDRLVTVSMDRVGWSEDGGRTWSSTLLPEAAYDIDFDGEQAITLRTSPYGTMPDAVTVVDLDAEAPAPPEALPELPPQAIRHPLRLEDGRLVVAIAEGMFILDGSATSMHSPFSYGPLQDAVVSQDPAMSGIWQSMIGPPWLYNSDSWSAVGGTTSGWPMRSSEAYDYHSATALAATESGLYACTGVEPSVEAAEARADGAGVYWLGSFDASWRAVGSGFPTVSESEPLLASCDGIWHIDGRLFAAAGGVAVETLVTQTVMRTLEDRVALAEAVLAFCDRLKR